MRAAVLAFVMLIGPQAALAQSCPASLAEARRLVLVVADKMTSTTATLQNFERASPDAPWSKVGGPASALIGHRGVAWAQAFRDFASWHLARDDVTARVRQQQPGATTVQFPGRLANDRRRGPGQRPGFVHVRQIWHFELVTPQTGEHAPLPR